MKENNSYRNVAGFRCLELIDRQTEDLCLTRCGIQQCPSNHKWGPKARPQYHMHFILEGKGYLEIENSVYHLKRGDIFLIPPNTVAAYHADSSDAWHYAFVSFVGTNAEKYVRQAGFSSHCFIRSCYFPPERFSSLIHEMLEAHQLTITNELKRTAILFELFSLLTESYQAANPSSKQTHYDYCSDAYLEHALQFIQFNYNRNIQVADIANYIGITRSYLFNIFKQNLNMAPKEYLLHCRMDKAKQLLVESSDTISDIAQYIGYNDPFTFSRMFHNMTGMSPSEYRRRQTES